MAKVEKRYATDKTTNERTYHFRTPTERGPYNKHLILYTFRYTYLKKLKTDRHKIWLPFNRITQTKIIDYTFIAEVYIPARNTSIFTQTIYIDTTGTFVRTVVNAILSPNQFKTSWREKNKVAIQICAVACMFLCAWCLYCDIW